jgi:plasmid stability protein
MPSLSVRNIDETDYRKLKLRAARNGVSIEEEVRQLIRRSVATPEEIGSLALWCFGSALGVEVELPERSPHEPIDLGR